MDFDLLSLRNFFKAIQLYGWPQVLIELTLIGAFVYVVLRFLRGTRGARMIKGVGFVLVVLYLVVRLIGAELKLDRINYLYGRFLLFASFAVVVVFQPEIRRALMRLGETRLFRSLTAQLNDDVEALVEAATFLARRKIGALIAIEREVGLGGIAETGTRINADLSAALLNTIFWPNSPLHDLGVIVSGGRVMYAGVQFPLAEVGDLDRELGSRHRAAVGMSQESDAIVVVVSEQTGDISIADRGRLLRKLNAEQLRSILVRLLGREETTSGPQAATPKEPAVNKPAEKPGEMAVT
jgi:diadenylate cyclase